MRSSINDDGIESLLHFQLKVANVSWLELKPFKDISIGDHTLAVFTGTLSKKSDNKTHVLNAWIVVGGNMSAFYNQDNYPTVNDAIAQHIGRLALEGKILVVDAKHGRVRRRNRKAEPDKT